MTKTKETRKQTCNVSSKKSSSRDAVESAIDRAKGNRRITWEAIIAKTPRRISLWEDQEPRNGNSSKKETRQAA